MELPRVRGFVNTGDHLNLILSLSEKASPKEIDAVARYIQVPPRALHNTVVHAAPKYQTATICCTVMTHMRLPKRSEDYLLGVTILPHFLVGGSRCFAGVLGELMERTCEAVMRHEEESAIRNSSTIREAHQRLVRLRTQVDRCDLPGATYRSHMFARVYDRCAIGIYHKLLLS
jgi:hypothetical protein